MINKSNKNSNNELWNDEQYRKIIQYVQQTKNQKRIFEQDVEQWILNTIDPSQYDWTELRHNSTQLSKLRNSAGEIIHDYVSLCAWETIDNNWTYNDELCELSNFAYDFSCSGRFVDSSEKENIKWSYGYWEENLSPNIDVGNFLRNMKIKQDYSVYWFYLIIIMLAWIKMKEKNFLILCTKIIGNL